MDLYFTSRADNDLYRTLSDLGRYFPRYDDLWDAVDEAPEGAGVLALADAYPTPIERVSQDLLNLARRKKLRLYIEYPLELAGFKLGKPELVRWQRPVICSDFFTAARTGTGAAELGPNRILAMHACWYVPVEAKALHMVLARAAGYREIAFGLPTDASPLLFSLDGQTLVATSKLSQFITARYAPRQDWAALWERLLCWLANTDDLPRLFWEPTVTTAYGRKDTLADDAEPAARELSVTWFRRHALYAISPKKGAIEGFEGEIDAEGEQLPRTWPRADCIAESAMALAYDWHLAENPDSRYRAMQMMDYVWSPDLYCGDAQSPCYGLVNWSERNPIFYGDDNARVLLAALATRQLLKETRWDEPILRCLLANLRTTGKLGFRHNRLEAKQLGDKPDGWRRFHDEESTSLSPHYQAYLWAAYLWAYSLTGYEGFLGPAKSAIRKTMEAYPSSWRWTNGLSQEMARMLLPLSFLMRVEDTPEHRSWLDRIGADLLALQQQSGAVREKLGDLAQGKYPPPQSNEAYGTSEASLIQTDGDPVCDLLYTANFAFLGLHEAAAGTGDANLHRAEDRLAEFLCRIQVRSGVHPYLDGAWMRAFDYQLWEYYGSSSDLGWGAWCVETGWTNAWINAVLAMREAGGALFDTAMATSLAAMTPRLVEEMEL